MTKILVLGASGLLGLPTFLEARKRYADEGRVAGTCRTRPPALEGIEGILSLDLGDAAAVETLLEDLKPKVVINCAGIVKSICRDAYEAITVNAAAPHLVARTIEHWGGRLVQVSTDCVFSGKRGPSTEEHEPDATDLYGRTKLMGEVLRSPHVTARTSFIGFEPASSRGLLAWFLARKGEVRGFRGALWSGLTADRLAAVLLDLAERREVTGLLHVAGEAVDKYQLLLQLAEVFGKEDVHVHAADEPKIDRRLDGSRLASFGIEVPPMRSMLEGLKRWHEEHRNLFPGEPPGESGGASA